MLSKASTAFLERVCPCNRKTPPQLTNLVLRLFTYPLIDICLPVEPYFPSQPAANVSNTMAHVIFDKDLTDFLGLTWLKNLVI